MSHNNQNGAFKCQYDHLLISLSKYSNGTLLLFKITFKLPIYDLHVLTQITSVCSSWTLHLNNIKPLIASWTWQGMFHRCQHCSLLASHQTSSHLEKPACSDQPKGNTTPPFSIHSHSCICHHDTYYYLTLYFTFIWLCAYYLWPLMRMTYLWV